MRPISRTHAVFCLALALPTAGCTIAPNPLTDMELSTAAASNKARVVAQQEAIGGQVTLYDAMARALKYNLDHKVEAAEHALRLSELDLQHFSLLPNLVVQSGYSHRNNDNASFSRNILTGQTSLATSSSQERVSKTADIGFSWNILDFGLSYVRAHQAADKSLVQLEMQRKVAHRIVEDVRSAYWRAVTAEELVKRLQDLERRTRAALADSRALSAEQQTSPLSALTQERELVEIQRTLVEIQRELATAKTQLAALMNVKPGSSFSVVAPPRVERAPSLTLGADAMIDTALLNRPELREVAYKRRINAHEAKAQMLELLPGLQLVAGANHDANAFLYNNDWVSIGAKASWNVMKLFSLRARREVNEATDAMLDERALALTMAVMTQVHVARVRYMHASRELAAADDYLGVQRRLLSQIKREAAEGRISNQTQIREELTALVAEAKRNIAFASLQTAFANVFASMGVDPLPGDTSTDASVAELSGRLKALWVERGDAAAGMSKIRVAQR